MIGVAEVAALGLQVIASVTKSLSDMHAGTLTPAQAQAQIEADIAARVAQLASDRAEADAALKAKFAPKAP